MSRGRVAMALALGLSAQLLPVRGGAGDGLSFFDDDRLSFERAKAPSADPARPAAGAPPEGGPGAETVPATQSRPRPSAVPAAPAVAAGPAPRPEAQVTAGRAPPPPQRIGGETQLEILRVRALTREERAATEGKLRCTSPLAAEIRPGGALRAAISAAFHAPAGQLPERITWFFGRYGPCFDAAATPGAAQLLELDGAARRAAPPEGGR